MSLIFMPIWKNFIGNIAVEHSSCSNVAFKIYRTCIQDTEDEPFLKLNASSIARVISHGWLCLHIRASLELISLSQTEKLLGKILESRSDMDNHVSVRQLMEKQEEKMRVCK